MQVRAWRQPLKAAVIPEAFFAPAVTDFDALWERYSDAELSVIPDFSTRSAARLGAHAVRVAIGSPGSG